MTNTVTPEQKARQLYRAFGSGAEQRVRDFESRAAAIGDEDRAIFWQRVGDALVSIGDVRASIAARQKAAQIRDADEAVMVAIARDEARKS